MKDVFLHVFLILTISGMLSAQNISHEKFVVRKINTDFNYLNPDKYYLIKYKGAEGLVLQNGGDIVRRVSPGVAIIKGNASFKSDAEVWAVNDLWKFAPGALKTGNNEFIIKSNDPQMVLQIIPDTYSPKIINGFIYIKGELSSVITDIAPIKEVFYIGAESLRPKEESAVLDLNLRPNHVNVVHKLYPELSGEGINLSIHEEKFDYDDIDFSGRVNEFPNVNESTSRHATEMATIAAGNGNSFVTGRGVAPGVSLFSSDFSDIVPDRIEDYQNYEISVQNHSFGTEIESFYGAIAEEYDKLVDSLPGLIHVFSSGNSGFSSASEGDYANIQGAANLTGNYKQAKNVLTIGSIDTTGVVPSFVSKGPAYDGRIKPEFVTYSNVGSSNSAALMSGIVVLLQQKFKEIHNQLPDFSVIKSVLMATSKDELQQGPDYSSGYGSVNAIEAIRCIENDNIISGLLSPGESNEYSITIPENTNELKLALSWVDPPINAGSFKALINDLDVKLQSPNGDIILPWVIDATPTADILTINATRGVDNVNNGELITMVNPPAGIYKIKISSASSLVSSQDFSVAWKITKDNSFEWYAPLYHENMPYNGETPSYFRWNSTIKSSGTLFIRWKDGKEQLIGQVDDVSSGKYWWVAPDTFATAQAILKTPNDEYISDEFIISRPVRPRVVVSCSDSLIVSWNKLVGLESYELQLFDESSKRFKSVNTDIDTFAVIPQTVTFPIFRIIPSFNNIEAISSLTVFSEFQQASCFLSSFFAQRSVEEKGIDLIVGLGSSLGIEKVEVYRTDDNLLVAEINNANLISGNNFVLDPNPTEGINSYQCKVIFENGEILLSQIVSEYFYSDTPGQVFPNPVSNGEELKIFTRKFNSIHIFSLISLDGRVLVERSIYPEKDFIKLNKVKQGVYVYKIIGEEINITGKLIVY
ncbi:S8 family peptidase [Marinigracilibium pacificum]|uniref:S8 family serine peptidase n=1 Tax=Marinigracilibium pacificum TaxID=2729599 RepID=A0A848IVD8_9BACT|nr:S8 family peptidase [Marinigracilibium pacificum]NMM48443.1 S8 family serine peptidase [Marinigracilibium pacificum]